MTLVDIFRFLNAQQVTQIIFMQDGMVHFHKTVEQLKEETGEQKISKAIAQILKKNQNA